MKTYEIPTSQGIKTVQANSKAEALAMVQGSGSTLALNKPQSSLGMPKIPKAITPGATSSVSPASITPPTPSLGATGMSAEINQSATQDYNDYIKSLESKSLSAEVSTNKALEDYIASLKNDVGVNELTAQKYAEKGGVDDLEKQLRDINKQILGEQSSLTAKLAELDKNSSGMFGGALETEKERAKTESLARQASLSIIQQGIRGDYDSAKTIADRAVAVQLEKQKNLNEALRVNYEANKDLFSKAEQRAFNASDKKREEEYKKEEERLKSISDLSIEALKNGAPMSVFLAMRNAKTLEEAITAGKQYTQKQTNESKIASINTQLQNHLGSDGHTDTGVYAQLRATSGLSPTEFDNRFGYLVNPNARAQLGITNAVAGTQNYTKSQLEQTLNQQIGSADWNNYSDDIKRAYVFSLGLNPDDYNL